MTGNDQRKVNKEFHSAFATISVTILSIMLAFYGIALVSLSQQAQSAYQNQQTYAGKAQASEESAVSYLRQTDNAIRDFAYTTEPLPGSANWSIPMDQQENIFEIFSTFKSEYPSLNDIVNSDVPSILGNFTEGSQMDETARDWLTHNNVTYFLADYIGAIFPLHDLIHGFYEQFPSPPAYRNQSQAIVFIDDNFLNTQTFLNWFQKYQSFYLDVSDAHSKISFALNGISQAYLDSATMDLQDLQMLSQENPANAFFVQSDLEQIAYDKAMSTYFPSVFASLDRIYSSATNATDYISQYAININQSKSYEIQKTSINDLAVKGILPSVVGMAISGVVSPMCLLGLANKIQPILSMKWRYLYYFIIGASILVFFATTILSINVLWSQISKLFPP